MIKKLRALMGKISKGCCHDWYWSSRPAHLVKQDRHVELFECYCLLCMKRRQYIRRHWSSSPRIDRNGVMPQSDIRSKLILLEDEKKAYKLSEERRIKALRIYKAWKEVDNGH